MNDAAHLDRLRKDAADCACVRDKATDREKRELFDRLAQHLDQLASEVARVMNGKGS